MLFMAVPTTLQAQKSPVPMATSECYECVQDCDPESYPDGSHLMQPTWFPVWGGTYEHLCIPYAGCDGHPSCRGAMAEQEADEFYAAINGTVDGNFNPVLDVIGEYPQYAALNLDRMHLQITSPCDEDIIVASIPLTGEQVTAVIIAQPGIEYAYADS